MAIVNQTSYHVSFSCSFFHFSFIFLFDVYFNKLREVFIVAQKALKEKEEHVEQLLVERDLERSELARMAARVDEVMLLHLI